MGFMLYNDVVGNNAEGGLRILTLKAGDQVG